MGQVLYRKYRSKNLDEIVGQEHITKTLKRALTQGQIAHAYLFTGPKGVGKTSIARILAHEVNNLPYSDDSAHLDIIEIDAASNRRIDEIRELRERVHVTPSSATYKVYIIDEVHMLTREAFNALLKTLEEPPAHVIFILATTEVHKLPETIISRTQRFNFKPVPPAQVINHLKQIAKAEKITIDDEALTLLAEFGEGSFRDSISLLDQARSQSEKITRESVQELLGIAPSSAITNLLEAVNKQDTLAVVTELGNLEGQGFAAAMVAKQLGQRLREQLLEGAASLPAATIIALLKDLLLVPAAHNPSSYLELALLNVATYPASQTAEAETTVLSEPSAPAPASTPKPSTAQKPTPPVQAAASDQSPVPLDAKLWPAVLAAVKENYNTLYSILRMATPTFRSGEVELGVQFAFHQKRLSEAKNRQILADILQRLAHQPVNIVCILTETTTPAKNDVDANDNNPLSTISNIFGGAELLE